jgi:galactose mutarotase-like enzyme
MNHHTLTTEKLTLSVLPENGAAITEGLFLGKSFFAKPPYTSIVPTPLGTESDWVAAWNGGWQPLIPSAGGEYLKGKHPQGFHGNASQARWSVTNSNSNSISLNWSDEDLESERAINISDNEINVRCSLLNLDSSPRPVIITEHLILGSDFLNSEITLEPVGNAQFRELAYDGSTNGAEFAPWETFEQSGWSKVNKNTPARMGVFSDTSCIKLCNELYEIEISWDASKLPFLWIWEEMGQTMEAPWNGKFWALGIEPSSAADGVGLSGGPALTLQVNEKFDWSVNLKIHERAGK